MAASRDGDRDVEGGDLSVSFVHARWRNFFWAALLLPIGVLMLLGFGWLGKVASLAVLAAGAWSAVAFVRTFLHQPGGIALAEGQVKLTPRLCSPAEITLGIDDVRHAYLIKRAVPWAVSGPVLVVEAKDATWWYPRDWFASEADQRRIMTAINRRLGRL